MYKINRIGFSRGDRVSTSHDRGLGIGDWGLGIGDWGLGIGDGAQVLDPLL
ncbi:MAG: hypothetical protein KA716_08560 [Gloeotrichia echinulata DEX184]|nr:hypothetical protein [Gloeotrichia echinulata DEX184]